MLKKIRQLLQQSWFVGILVAIAIGISVRNIVLPLIDMGGGVKAVVREGESPVETGGLIKRVGQGPSVAGGVPENYPEIRAEFFANQEPVARNPFKIIVPPKVVVVKRAVVTEPVQQVSQTFLQLTQELVDKLFSLQAIMASGGARLALISREVVRVGDNLPVGYVEKSGDQLIQQALAEGLIRYGMPFEVVEIQNERVVISREERQFTLHLKQK